MAETRQTVYCHCKQYQTVPFLKIKIRLNVLRTSADLQLYDSEFQTEGALTLKAFADNVSVLRSTESNSLSDDCSVRAPCWLIVVDEVR